MDKGVHPYKPESGTDNKCDKTDYVHQTVEDKKLKTGVLLNKYIQSQVSMWL